MKMDAKTVFTFAGGVVLGLIIGVLIFGGGPSGGGSPVATSVAPQQPQVDKIKLQREISQLEELIKTDPKNYQAWKQMADKLFDIGEPADSIKAYSTALDLDDSDPNVWTDMGVMYRQVGDFTKALEAFDTAIERGPNHTISRLNRGVVLVYDLQRVDEGIAAWESFLKLQPTGPQADDVRNRIAAVRQQPAPALPAGASGELPPDHPPLEGGAAGQPAPESGSGDPAGYFPKPGE